MKLFVLSKENLPLAAAEAERLHEAKASSLRSDLLFLDAQRHETGLAFTREIHDVLFAAKAKDLPAALAVFPWHEHVQSPFLVRKRGASQLSEPELAGYVWRGLEAAGKEPSVDLKAPVSRVHVFFVEDEAVVTILRWENDERFFDRRAHLRPRNHPTSLSPKLARAMVNLAGPPAAARSVLDPFCGSGGLLLEGSLAGREMTGIDIDPEQVKRSEENLSSYGAAAVLTVGDAKRCDGLGSFGAVVTDLPYGKSSRLENAEETFTRFFAAAAGAAPVAVVAMDSSFPLGPCFAAQWRESASFAWYVHKSMAKRIYLLERK